MPRTNLLDRRATPGTYHAGQDWRHKSACLDVDPELFHPVATTGPAWRNQVNEAKAVCKSCPVRQECLDLALGAGDDNGIFGGLDPEERRALPASRKLQALTTETVSSA